MMLEIQSRGTGTKEAQNKGQNNTNCGLLKESGYWTERPEVVGAI